MMGRFDGIFRFVSLYRLPDYMAQGWEIMFVEPGYSAFLRAPI